jgi:single-strand DNA-binding protein
MGRLARDPEMRQTPTGTPVARLTIAVNRRFAREGSQQADFISCTAWRTTAEFICKYFRKGSMIAVSGSIQTRSWDGQDGKKQYSTEVVIDEAYFTGSKAETGTGGSAQGYSQSYGAPQGAYSQSGYQQQPYPQDNFRQPEPFDTSSGGGARPNFDDFSGAGFSAADGSEDDLPF